MELIFPWRANGAYSPCYNVVMFIMLSVYMKNRLLQWNAEVKRWAHQNKKNTDNAPLYLSWFKLILPFAIP